MFVLYLKKASHSSKLDIKNYSMVLKISYVPNKYGISLMQKKNNLINDRDQ